MLYFPLRKEGLLLATEHTTTGNWFVEVLGGSMEPAAQYRQMKVGGTCVCLGRRAMMGLAGTWPPRVSFLKAC